MSSSPSQVGDPSIQCQLPNLDWQSHSMCSTALGRVDRHPASGRLWNRRICKSFLLNKLNYFVVLTISFLWIVPLNTAIVKGIIASKSVTLLGRYLNCSHLVHYALITGVEMFSVVLGYDYILVLSCRKLTFGTWQRTQPLVWFKRRKKIIWNTIVMEIQLHLPKKSLILFPPLIIQRYGVSSPI